MDVVGLVSGGKDSWYNMMCAVRDGHKIVALANLQPRTPGELDSYMYQTVGSEGIEMQSQAAEIPLYRQQIYGSPIDKSSQYSETKGDEVEDLYFLLQDVKEKHPTVKGVSVGAILSSYQKQRVENVCKRLDLVPLCYLWGRDQAELLREMIESEVHAVIIKVAAIGLNEKYLGMTLKEIEPTMLRLQKKYGVHPCGEGGEFETFVLDCPLFKKRLNFETTKVVNHDKSEISPVSYLKFWCMPLEKKENEEISYIS